MADEVNVTTSEQMTEVAEPVENNDELVNDMEFEDSTEVTEEEQAKAERVEKAKQTRAQNAEYARQRREAETAQRISNAERAAREQGIIDALGGKNPYTNEPMKDSADVAEFLMMREIEAKGGDPLSSSDYNKYQKEKAREEQRKASEEATQRNWYQTDKADFVAKHPDVNINNLIKDANFASYADGKVGRVPLAQIYEGYIRITGGAKAEGAKTVKQNLANAKASPGALSTAGTTDSTFLSKADVEAHRNDKEWIRKNYSLIEKSMKKW